MDIINNQLKDQHNLTWAISTVAHGNMSFKYGAIDQVITNRQNWLKQLNITPTNCVTAELAHGTDIVLATKQTAGQNILNPDYTLRGDAIVTQEKDLYLFLIVADCLIWFVFDPINQVVALIHSSRVNSENNIVGKTIDFLQQKFNSNPENLIIGSSPFIQQCCYAFPNIDRLNPIIWREYVWRGNDNMWHIDLGALNHNQLTASGVQAKNIYLAHDCTFESSDYFSHHRDQVSNQPDQGRFAALIGLKS